MKSFCEEDGEYGWNGEWDWGTLRCKTYMPTFPEDKRMEACIILTTFNDVKGRWHFKDGGYCTFRDMGKPLY